MSNSQIKPDDLNLVDPDLLPPQIRQLVQIIGLPATIVLLDHHGGTLLRIPMNSDDSRSQLGDIVGIDAAKKLCAAKGGKRLELPKADKIIIQIRNHAIHKARETMSANDAAKYFNLSRRQIINITSDDNENPTACLFDNS